MNFSFILTLQSYLFLLYAGLLFISAKGWTFAPTPSTTLKTDRNINAHDRRSIHLASSWRSICMFSAPLHNFRIREQRRNFVAQLVRQDAESKAEMELDDDEVLIRRIEQEVWAESGVELDQLINPSKVVNLERDLLQLRLELRGEMGSGREGEGKGDVGARRKLEELIDKKQRSLLVEKRAVMRGWLKNLFLGQSALAGLISLAMVYDAVPGYGHIPLVAQALGYWTWWLFIIPSLRARKPQAMEKEALNIAFIASPLVSLAMPSFTLNTAAIWWANFAVTAAAYVYAYVRPRMEKEQSDEGERNGEGESGVSLPPALVKAFKALDYGSGQERGARR